MDNIGGVYEGVGWKSYNYFKEQKFKIQWTTI
jgi:hypothetical protein